MKAIVLVFMTCLSSMAVGADGIVVHTVKGDAWVRHGATESWMPIRDGDILKPDDSMKTGKDATAVLIAPVEENQKKRMVLPSEVIVDMSDIRTLSPEELMLKLAMEKVRASSYEWKNSDMRISNTTMVHGSDKSAQTPLPENRPELGLLQMNGTKVLFDNGFYSTCALKAMEVFRLYPPLGKEFTNRLLVAQALEKANLRGEALSEYVRLLSLPDITAQERAQAQEGVVRLRAEMNE